MTAAALAVMATGLVASPALAAKERLTGEAKLAKLLEGREAGKPVSCISSWQARETRVIDGTAIVYRVGGTLYVNRPTNADMLDDDDILVTRQHIGQLCRPDTVQLHDRTSFFYSGFVGLQDFVPYRKVASAN
ncbi:hypothetical protein ABVV53_16730 [Novosphingobium sp. RD2P27]|uniref:Uncharacterized protein n=1 Tax=Novosphingobium kalidii TaxID=3230299 RepID=A0ABV2D5D7_9SPHN